MAKVMILTDINDDYAHALFYEIQRNLRKKSSICFMFTDRQDPEIDWDKIGNKNKPPEHIICLNTAIYKKPDQLVRIQSMIKREFPKATIFFVVSENHEYFLEEDREKVTKEIYKFDNPKLVTCKNSGRNYFIVNRDNFISNMVELITAHTK